MQASLRLGSTRLAARPLVTRRAVAPVTVAPRPMVAGVYTAPSCSFLGGSFSSAVMRPQPAKGRGALVVMAAGGKSMGCTKGGTNRKRRRTSGFRTRMATPNGRKVLKSRRKKGRHVLVPASMRKSGGKK